MEPLKVALREKKFTLRHINYDESKAGGIDGLIAKGEAEMTQLRNVAIRWCRAHFGEVFNGYMHLKIIQAFVESVLRYGLPVDFLSFLFEPNAKIADKDLRARLTKALLTVRPDLAAKKVLQLEEDEEGGAEDADSNLPYVCLKFSVVGGVNAAANGNN